MILLYVFVIILHVIFIFFLRMPPKKLTAWRRAWGKQLYQMRLAKRQRMQWEERECTTPCYTPSREAVLAEEGKTTVAIRKSLLFSCDQRECIEGEGLASVRVDRLTKLVQCIGKCDSCDGKVSLKSRFEQFEVFLEVTCGECDKVIYVDGPEKIVEPAAAGSKTLYETNMRNVFSSMVNDIGYAGLMGHCAISGVPQFSHKTYQMYKSVICNAVANKVKVSKEKNVQAIFKYYEEVYDIHPDENGILDIDVSFDGTWMTRGHGSKIGVAFVIEFGTGIIIDFQVLSSYCASCDILKSKYAKKTLSFEEFQKKQAEHKDKCKINYKGTSGGMEKEAALVLWGRSLDLNLRYKVMVSDGDASTYKSLLEINSNEGPYGLSHKIVKEECKNHLHKRMGSRLFALKRSMTEMRETATGKVQSRGTLEMTDSTIKSLQQYYLAAVKRHSGGSWKDLKIDIMSTYFHCTSTDEKPQHSMCSAKWCFYKQDIEAKVPMRSHEKMEVAIRCSDPAALEKVHEIYQDLTRKDLLECCLIGRTQNPYESLHSKLWAKCSRNKFVGYDKVLFAAHVTIAQHNLGYEEGSLLKLIGRYGSADTLEIEKVFERERPSPRPPKRKREESEDHYYSNGNF